jgi:hypothetical protein
MGSTCACGKRSAGKFEAFEVVLPFIDLMCPRFMYLREGC